MRTGLAYLKRKSQERRRKPKKRSYEREVHIFDTLEGRLNKCCTKYGKQKPVKNGCVACPDKEECVRLFEIRCELK